MTPRSLIVVASPPSNPDLLEFDLDAAHGAFLIQLLEHAKPFLDLEWIEVGEGTLVDRILRRRPPPSPEKLARAQVNARHYRAVVKVKKRKKQKPYAAPRRKKCPHCGELFSPKGIGPHVMFAHTRNAEHRARLAEIGKRKHEAWLAKQATAPAS